MSERCRFPPCMAILDEHESSDGTVYYTCKRCEVTYEERDIHNPKMGHEFAVDGVAAQERVFGDKEWYR